MSTLVSRHSIRRAVSVAVLLLAVSLARTGGVGPSADASAPRAGTTASAPFDRLFIDMMAPHHLGAVAMARVALSRAQHAQIKRLARSIITAQNQEISQMKRWRAAWYGSAATPPGDRMPMLPGLSIGMSDMGGDVARLKTATPFDKAFIAAMMPHHQLAIAAAKLELAHGSHSQLKALALAIIEDQARELGLMTAYSELWYATSTMPGMNGMRY